MKIETPKMSEFLLEEFMKPLNVSAYKLAKAVNVPVSRIQDILHDRRKITIDTSIRLGLYFGVSEMFFLNLQNDIDLRNEKELHQNEYSLIVPLNLASIPGYGETINKSRKEDYSKKKAYSEDEEW